jgi:hypothetical protein
MNQLATTYLHNAEGSRAIALALRDDPSRQAEFLAAWRSAEAYVAMAYRATVPAPQIVSCGRPVDRFPGRSFPIPKLVVDND